MTKKLLAAYIAFAFIASAVLPSNASAINDPDLTQFSELVPVGTSLKATNTGAILMTSEAGNVLVACTTATLSGTVTQNDGTAVAAEVTSATFGGTGTKAPLAPHTECTGTFGNLTMTPNPSTWGLPWCLRSDSTLNADEFYIRGAGCSSISRPIRFVLDSTTVGECGYERSAAIPGTYTTSGSQISISNTQFVKAYGSFLCPAWFGLDMTFTLENGGTGVTFIFS